MQELTYVELSFPEDSAVVVIETVAFDEGWTAHKVEVHSHDGSTFLDQTWTVFAVEESEDGHKYEVAEDYNETRWM